MRSHEVPLPRFLDNKFRIKSCGENSHSPSRSAHRSRTEILRPSAEVAERRWERFSSGDGLPGEHGPEVTRPSSGFAGAQRRV